MVTTKKRCLLNFDRLSQVKYKQAYEDTERGIFVSAAGLNEATSRKYIR